MVRPSSLARALRGFGVVGLAMLAGLFACCAVFPSRARADEEDGPRLRLAIDRPVHEGERLSLRWEGSTADIEELEILLSVDGGRTYEVSISPSLDPRTGKYDWTVPNLGGARAWLRVRFNRDGQEIEGEPTPLTEFIEHGMDLPEHELVTLGRESERERERERSSRSEGGRGTTAPARESAGSGEAGEGTTNRRAHESISIRVLDLRILSPFSNSAPARVPPANTLSRFIPPRN